MMKLSMKVIGGLVVAVTMAASFVTPGIGLAGVASAAQIPRNVGQPAQVTHAKPGKTTRLRYTGTVPRLHTTNLYNDYSSRNWSGYVSEGGAGHDNSVQGTVTVPTASGKSGDYVALWYGLDGAGNHTVEQAGIAYTPGYGWYPWVEMYPAPEQSIIGVNVSPGDQIHIQVTRKSSTVYTVSMTDSTANWSFAYDATMPSGYAGQDASAEAIAEAPTNAVTGKQIPLATFGSAAFRDNAINGKANAYTASDRTHMRPDGKTEATQVSALDSKGNFTIKSAPAPAPRASRLAMTYTHPNGAMVITGRATYYNGKQWVNWSGENVTLQYKSGSKWVAWRTIKSGKSGTVQFKCYTPSRYWRLTDTATSSVKSATTGQVHARGSSRATIGAKRSGRYVTVSGKVQYVNSKVRWAAWKSKAVELQVKSGSKWKNYRALRANSAGNVSRKIKSPASHYWRIVNTSTGSTWGSTTGQVRK
jgi:hypothetical protein